MAERVPVPAAVAELRLLDRVDYDDAFAAPTLSSRTAEQWARSCLQDDPPAILRLAQLVLAPFGVRSKAVPSTGINGLQILRNQPESIVLSFKINIATPRIVFSTRLGHVVMSTLIQFNGPAGRAIWAVLGPLHRATARSLVDQAARVAARDSTDATD